MNILTLNAGSSSIKFALFRQDPARQRLLRGQVDRIGSTDTATDVDMSDAALLAWLEAQPAFGAIAGIGHRVVHGMQHTEPTAARNRTEPADRAGDMCGERQFE